MNWELTNGTLVTPDDILKDASLTIDKGAITQVGKKGGTGRAGMQVDINGLLVFPGLIDCHDHLLGTYVPRVGDRRPYLNWLEWDNDLKSSPVYKERQLLNSADIYLMGGYRHLITGVTTVQDHIPHFVRDLFAKDMPVNLAKDYAMAHSVGSFALAWGDGITVEHEKALENDIPFITHCSEGFDPETINSVSVLNRSNALSDHTVLIHGIAFTDEDIDLLAEKGCHVVWCPVSNLYMFQKTARVKELMDRGVNVVLGTDSPMSGSINVFEELFIAKKYFKSTYGRDLPDRELVDMLTVRAADALKLKNKGSLEEGKDADLLIIAGDARDPYHSMVNMSFKDIMLVVIDGVPRYGDEIFIPVFEKLNIKYEKVKVAGHRKIVNGEILPLIDRVRESVKFEKELEFLPVEPW